MLKCIMLLIPILLYSTAFYSHAYYPTYVSNTKHLTEIKNVNANRIIVIESSEIGRPIHNEVRDILNSIDDELKETLTIVARDGINGVSGGKFRGLLNSEINGEITTKIITDGNGIVRAEIGGFTLSAKVKFDYARVTLYGEINTSKLKFSADYNVITGKVYNLKDIGNTKVYVDIDGNGIFNGFIAKLAEKFIGIFKPSLFNDLVNDALGKLVNNSYYVGGLDDVIPEGEWIVGEVDIGQEIKDAINGISPGQYVSLTMSERNQRYYYGGNFHRNYYRNKLKIDVSNNYIATYENEPVFSTGNWINPCHVGGASGGCYEP
jgi:hypothetical protein